MDYESLKFTLLKNDMIYIGIMKYEDFFMDDRAIVDAQKIVVLARGVENKLRRLSSYTRND
jgi:hypothetical protein